jgi:YggT family protein
MIFIRILSSWIPELAQTRFMHFISFFVDPYLNIFRSIIPPLGMIDISPIVAIFALQFIESGIKYVIVGLL